MHYSPLEMLNSYLIKGERPHLHLLISLDCSTGGRGDCLPKDWWEYWGVSLVYLYGGTRQVFDWYQSSLSNYDEST